MKVGIALLLSCAFPSSYEIQSTPTPVKSFFMAFLVRATALLALSCLLPQLVTGLASSHTVQRPQLRLPVLPANWLSKDCYTDEPTRRTLRAAYTSSDKMTIESCIAFCSDKQYSYAGVEYGRECFCDNAIQTPGMPTNIGDCNMPCTGNGKESCGASNRLNVFFDGSSAGPSNQPILGYSYLGCFTDNTTSRTLSERVEISGGLTPEKCAATCMSMGFTYSGTEFATECYCGNSIRSSIQAPESDCNMTCEGNPASFCGGPNRLTLYRYDPPIVTPNPQTCISIREPRFTLEAVYRVPPISGPLSLPLKVIRVSTGLGIGLSILTTCVTAGCASGAPYYVLAAGVMDVDPSSLLFRTVSSTADVGETPSFLSSLRLLPPPALYSGYCSMPNLSGGFPLLAANGRSDQWALCPNNAAAGRLDVVFAPVVGHPHYTQDSCKGVELQMTFPG